MAFVQISSKEISDIIRKYAKGKSIKSISEESGHDRKTVRKYIMAVKEQLEDLTDKEALKKVVKTVLPKKPGRPRKQK